MDRLEVARVRAHLEGAHDALAAPSPIVRDALRRYIDAEDYPKNRHAKEMTPIFVDEDGARCALAALLEATDEHAIVERIRRTRNFAYVAELAEDEELGAWLSRYRLTLAEAARIQPSYSNTADSTYQPTVAIIATAQAGGSTVEGGELAAGPGARLGVRRVTASNGACDHCVHQSMAWFAEYTRTIVVGVGATNHASLVMQYDLNEQAREHQFYVFGGPLASIDEAARPGFGAGTQIGAGFSFRGRSYPLLFELVLSTLGGDSGFTMRGGLTVGAAF